MHVLEIKKMAELYIPGLEISDEDAISVVNEALDVLGDMGLVYGKITANVTAGEWAYMPEDATIVSVVDHNGEPYLGWKMRGQGIMFEDSGTYEIHARKVPKNVSSILEEPDVHPMFQRCLVTYLRGFFKLKDDDTSQDGHRLMAKFEEEAMRAFNILRRQYYPKTVKVIR